jgi:iron(II)-dependent oxidoreductase
MRVSAAPLVAALALLLFVEGSVLAQDRPIVAVFEIEDKSRSLDKALLGQLTEYLATEVGKAGVFQIVPPGDIKRALQDKRTESYKECFDASCQVELGRELAANKTLSTSVLKIGGVCTVSAALYDLKRMATELTASAKGECGPAALMGSLEKVAAELRAWSSGRAGGKPGFQEGTIGGSEGREWDVGTGEEVIARFASTPSGATVLLDGKMLCKETPCSKSVPSGAHRVSMQAERYLERTEQVVIARGAALEWKLDPDFGWLTVRSEPAGLEVKLNGEAVGRTPIERREVSPGGYEVLVGSPCHVEKGERVKVERGQTREVSLAVASREAGLSVKARDGKGNDLEADVLVDGQKVGTTPGRFKVSVCAKEAEVRHAKEGSVKKALSLREREVTTLEVELKGGGVAGLAWIFSRPAGIDFTKSEVTVAQYRACVEAGKCSAPDTGGNCNWSPAGREAHPVNCVDWNQATAFCAWAGGRLPTEEEWYAEASNGDKRAFPWGYEPVSCERAIWKQGGFACGKNGTWPVCSKPAGNSVSGLCDMSGNVWEWTSSSEDSARVLRGGSWDLGSPFNLRASVRSRNDPTGRFDNYGFRCGRPSR